MSDTNSMRSTVISTRDRAEDEDGKTEQLARSQDPSEWLGKTEEGFGFDPAFTYQMPLADLENAHVAHSEAAEPKPAAFAPPVALTEQLSIDRPYSPWSSDFDSQATAAMDLGAHPIPRAVDGGIGTEVLGVSQPDISDQTLVAAGLTRAIFSPTEVLILAFAALVAIGSLFGYYLYAAAVEVEAPTQIEMPVEAAGDAVESTTKSPGAQ